MAVGLAPSLKGIHMSRFVELLACEVYGLLKRADEKYLTERAYDNPKFVEDAVRDAALALKSDPGALAFAVEVENFESIHNHSAFARISSVNFADQS